MGGYSAHATDFFWHGSFSVSIPSTMPPCLFFSISLYWIPFLHLALTSLFLSTACLSVFPISVNSLPVFPWNLLFVFSSFIFLGSFVIIVLNSLELLVSMETITVGLVVLRGELLSWFLFLLMLLVLGLIYIRS